MPRRPATRERGCKTGSWPLTNPGSRQSVVGATFVKPARPIKAIRLPERPRVEPKEPAKTLEDLPNEILEQIGKLVAASSPNTRVNVSEKETPAAEYRGAAALGLVNRRFSEVYLPILRKRRAGLCLSFKISTSEASPEKTVAVLRRIRREIEACGGTAQIRLSIMPAPIPKLPFDQFCGRLRAELLGYDPVRSNGEGHIYFKSYVEPALLHWKRFDEAFATELLQKGPLRQGNITIIFDQRAMLDYLHRDATKHLLKAFKKLIEVALYSGYWKDRIEFVRNRGQMTVHRW